MNTLAIVPKPTPVEREPIVITSGSSIYPKPYVYHGTGPFKAKYLQYLETLFGEALGEVGGVHDKTNKFEERKQTFRSFCMLYDAVTLKGREVTFAPINRLGTHTYADEMVSTLKEFLQGKAETITPIAYLFETE
jgi:hypothetical protein